MRFGKVLCVFAVVGFSLAVAALGALGHSDGAPESAAVQGCTCHGEEDTGRDLSVRLEGLPSEFRPGTNYTVNLTITFNGTLPTLPPPLGMNSGGFALAASAGTLAPADDKAQLKGKTLTHTEAGNDERRWSFRWTAPQGDVRNVTFQFAGNAVNGDGLNDPLDAWKRGAAALNGSAPAAPPRNNTTAPEETQTPGPAAPLGALGSLAALAVVAARRRRRAE